MKDRIEKIIKNALSQYRKKEISEGLLSGYTLYIFKESERRGKYDGFLYLCNPDKASLKEVLSDNFKRIKTGYTPRIAFILNENELVVKDYRTDEKIKKTLQKINRSFISKLKKALTEPDKRNFEKLFNREDIIEEFWILYKKSRDYLLENIKGISDEDERIAFVDNLMMQMLTLWYLQEKRFFDGDTSYFITKFTEMEQKKLSGGFKDYHEFLIHFFEIIGNNVGNQYHEDDTFGMVVVLGPAIFLNGNVDQAAITIPDRWFYKEGVTDTLINAPPKKVGADVPLFNLFESRDWTKGNIDDFVLGAIYEKLITHIERKKLGAYYTPEVITEYICKNTIKPYLIDKINNETGGDFKSIDEIVESDDKEMLLHLFDSLKEIKILDPAVGSAHFLADASEVLLGVYEKIWDRAKELGLRLGLEITAADESGRLKKINLLEISDRDQFKIYVKFFIILSKNIYGVDINQSAINVARARLFLSIAKHFDVGKGCFIRFPNVHFNLRRGNSLIGYVGMGGGRGSEQSALNMFVGEKEAVYAAEPIRVVSELGGYLSETARTLGMDGDILEEIRGLNGILSAEMIGWDEFERVLRVKEKLIRILIASLNSEHAMPLNGLIKNITALFGGKLDERFAREHKIDLDALEKVGTFHWGMEFPEVFVGRGGFDVVIGNPPYVRADVEDPTLITQRNILENLSEFETLYEKWDLFIAFIEKSVRTLLNKKGKFSFIVSDAVCTVKYAEKMRTWLSKSFCILSIDFFEGYNVFEGIGIVPIVLVVDKSRKPEKTLKRIHSGGFKSIISEISVEQDSPALFKKNDTPILNYDYSDMARLSNICYISYGLRPNSDERYAKGEFKKEDLISDTYSEVCSKKYVEGKDINRYKIKRVRYLEWDTERSPKKLVRPTFEELYVGEKILRGVLPEGVLDLNGIVTNHSIVIFKRFIDLIGIENRSILNSIKKHNTLARVELEEISNSFSYKYLLALINSKFANEYLNGIRRHKLKNYFYPDDFRELPIPRLSLSDQVLFSTLVDYLHLLKQNSKNASIEEIEDRITYLDRIILESLVYELYFFEKFYEDGLYPEPKTYFSELVSKHLKPISYDRWAELHWKKQLEENLTPKEEKELEELETEDTKKIEAVYDAIANDIEIQKQIEKIKGHEWVRAVEGCE